MRKVLILTGVATLGATVVVLCPPSTGTASAAPTPATDSTKVPHYFGPSPNWANSPFTLPNADVKITGDGTGAEATATVNPTTGGLDSIDVTNPGHDYTNATVEITGGNSDAAATATLSPGGSVVGMKISAPGGGYDSFKVDVTGGGGSGAAATPSGGVDVVTVTNGGSHYTVPTVDFDLPDSPDGKQATGHIPMISKGDAIDGMDANGVISAVVVDDPGSGYTTAPQVVIRNGTAMAPISGSTDATATATLKLLSVAVDSPGAGYTATPTVSVTDPTGTGTGATVAATTDVGAITAITVTAPGSGYLTVGMKKFQDDLPLSCDPGVTGAGCPSDPAVKFIPTAVPETVTVSNEQADEYTIGLVQFRTTFSSDLPPTLVRAYVQIATAAVPGQHVPLYNELMDGTKKAVTDANGNLYYGVTAPQYMGPTIASTKDRPVRVIFRNLLPTGKDGNLFLPVDSTVMGSGTGPMAGMAAPGGSNSVTDGVRNPDCTVKPDPTMCFTQNRATLHLHGGVTPWISDGTPHQWITPAGENTSWPQGVSVSNVPDMMDADGSHTCAATTDGCETFYYTNQQSARLMFYHDHSWGITRLNVYAGEEAPYTITDDTEKALISSGTIPDAASTIPLIVQDRTFVPDDAQLKAQDPTWDTSKWGTKGSFWYQHVYMPAENPGSPSGMSAYGRWFYGPWFWPAASDTKNGPIANPYYDPKCQLDVPSTWTYQEAPYCEPEQIPGTPNISNGMEQFNDTPIVNGVAYPKVTLQPKTYRFRMLNGANDRFFNFQWYTADPTQGNGKTEVALKPAELEAAQTDPSVSPTPVDSNNPAAGPAWVQIANEGGFLPAPAVIDGQQPTTYITDPTRFDVGNVDKHSLTLAPAERADVLVDFSKFAGKTLILYNDAPAAFPGRIANYDYYTGAPDMAPVGAPKILPGYGPNTRTVMQVTIASDAPAPALNLTKLRTAFQHHANGSGVFESGQHPIIVGQAAYNSAYGTGFAGGSNCNVAGSTVQTCDGLVRVHDSTDFGFNTLGAPTTKMSFHLQPKAVHDEMNSTSFDEFGRMSANLGMEAQPATPGAQNVTLFPFVNPQTEMIDGTNLPTGGAGVKITPITTNADGTQIWRITHNGVDTHPLHFHLYDVQLINRVTWDNIIIPPDPNELGWKDTVRTSPLEDTIVALRPILPKVPFEIPNSIRPLDPMMPTGDTSMFNSLDVNGNPASTITNQLVNFGWEYVWHCHILSHEEMDMMRPVSMVVPPIKPDGISFTTTGTGSSRRVVVHWNDNSITETSFVVQRSSDGGTSWTTVGTSVSPLDQLNTHGPRTLTDPTANPASTYTYRVEALNKVGYGGDYPSMTAQSVSDPAGYGTATVAGPPRIGTPVAGNGQVTVNWQPPLPVASATPVTGYRVRTFAGNGATPTRTTTVGNVTSTAITGLTNGTTYTFDVAAINSVGTGPASARSAAVTPRSDVTPPRVTAVTPGANARSVSQSTSVTATFSEQVVGVDSTTVVLRLGTTKVTSTVSYNGTSRTATLNPSAALAADRTYTATVSGLRDLVGNVMSPYTWSFTTGPAPVVTSRTPASGATGVGRSSNVTATYSEAITGYSSSNARITVASTGVAVSATVSYNSTTHVITISPSATLASNTAYRVTLTGGTTAIRDLAGNPSVSDSWTFTTGTLN